MYIVCTLQRTLHVRTNVALNVGTLKCTLHVQLTMYIGSFIQCTLHVFKNVTFACRYFPIVPVRDHQ